MQLQNLDLEESLKSHKRSNQQLSQQVNEQVRLSATAGLLLEICVWGGKRNARRRPKSLGHWGEGWCDGKLTGIPLITFEI